MIHLGRMPHVRGRHSTPTIVKQKYYPHNSPPRLHKAPSDGTFKTLHIHRVQLAKIVVETMNRIRFVLSVKSGAVG